MAKSLDEEVAAQLARVTEQLQARLPHVAVMLEDASPHVTAYRRLPDGALAADLTRTTPRERLEPGDPQAQRCGRHLS